MISFEEAISQIGGNHRKALLWFNEHRGRRVSWAKISEQADNGFRLATQAKGIYKPAYTDFALSVRTLQDGPYPDKEVEYRSDGSWVCQYYQEKLDPSQRDTAFTNRGLMHCMAQKIPIGFLIKRKFKPEVEYEVLGVGFVMGWDNGYFTIEGVNYAGELIDVDDAARARASASHLIETYETDFCVTDVDMREKHIAMVAKRRGQSNFRAMLLEAYDGRCCISGCDLIDVLEAAHIMPYMGSHSNHPQNGLLLRADLHTLFDLGLICIDHQSKVVVASSVAKSTTYSMLAGVDVKLPNDAKRRPNTEALHKHRSWSGL